MSLFTVSYILLWALALIIAPIAITLLYQHAYFLRKAELTKEQRGGHMNFIGRGAPSFSGVDMFSGAARNSSEWAGLQHVLLAFTSGCPSCKTLAAEIASLGPETLSGRNIVAVCIGSEKGCFNTAGSSFPVPVLRLDPASEPAQFFVSRGLPVAIIVNDSGIVADIINPGNMDLVFRAFDNVDKALELASAGWENGQAAIRQNLVGAVTD